MSLVLKDRTLKAISLILSYPSAELQDAMPEIGGVLAADTRLTAATRRALRPLVTALASDDVYELQEQFVMLFDRSRTLSLNLFEHVHGESRDRGGAMVSLVAGVSGNATRGRSGQHPRGCSAYLYGADRKADATRQRLCRDL